MDPSGSLRPVSSDIGSARTAPPCSFFSWSTAAADSPGTPHLATAP